LFRDLIILNKPHDEERNEAEKLLGEWLSAYNIIEIIQEIEKYADDNELLLLYKQYETENDIEVDLENETADDLEFVDMVFGLRVPQYYSPYAVISEDNAVEAELVKQNKKSRVIKKSKISPKEAYENLKLKHKNQVLDFLKKVREAFEKKEPIKLGSLYKGKSIPLFVYNIKHINLFLKILNELSVVKSKYIIKFIKNFEATYIKLSAKEDGVDILNNRKMRMAV